MQITKCLLATLICPENPKCYLNLQTFQTVLERWDGMHAGIISINC